MPTASPAKEKSSQQRTAARQGSGFPPSMNTFFAVVILVASFILYAALDGPGSRAFGVQLGFATIATLGLCLLGYQRSVEVLGRWDVFHPLGFPLVYLGFSFLAPFWVTTVLGTPVGSLRRTTEIAADTPTLLLFGVLGYAVGASVAFRAVTPREPKDRARFDASAQFTVAFAYILCLSALGLQTWQIYRGGVLVRGLNQTEYSLTDGLSVLTSLVPIAGVMTLLAGRYAQARERLLSSADVALIVALIIGTGLRGSRNSAISMLLIVAFVYMRRGASAGRILAFVIGIGSVFMFVVLRYRNSVRGVETSSNFAESLLGDMAPATFSTGAIANNVPEFFPYQNGSTMLVAVLRQLPSPIAVYLFGPPDDTGAATFRRVIGFNNPNGGLGFSIPAEGYLNFGVAGLVGICALVGLYMSWAYSRVSLGTLRASGVLYVIAVAVFPMALRADLLGFMKANWYPFLLVTMALAGASFMGREAASLARSAGGSKAARARGGPASANRARAPIH